MEKNKKVEALVESLNKNIKQLKEDNVANACIFLLDVNGKSGKKDDGYTVDIGTGNVFDNLYMLGGYLITVSKVTDLPLEMVGKILNAAVKAQMDEGDEDDGNAASPHHS